MIMFKEKYRIISRPCYFEPAESYYVAQFKFLNLFWMDIDYDKYYPGCSQSEHLPLVEQYVDALIHDKRIVNTEKVVKTYD